MENQLNETSHRCLICGRSYSRKDSLTNHLRDHTGSPYACFVCNKTFGQRTKRNQHMKTHSGETPYKCLTCKRSFTQEGHLTAHLRIHTSEGPYPCSLCDMSFGYSGDRAKHMKIHLQQKPLNCSSCGKSFKRAFDLARHMRIHKITSNSKVVLESHVSEAKDQREISSTCNRRSATSIDDTAEVEVPSTLHHLSDEAKLHTSKDPFIINVKIEKDLLS